MKNNSTSHKALGKCFKRAGLKDENDDPIWDCDKVIEKLNEAQAALKESQKKHQENHDSG
jgi:hypothetical protein